MKACGTTLKVLFVLLVAACGKPDVIDTSSKIKKVEFYNPNGVLYNEVNIGYNDVGKIVQVGNSTYHYDEQGRVEKEIVLIENPLETGEDIALSYRYGYDSEGRLHSVQLETDLGNPNILSGAIAIPANRRIEYKHNRIEDEERYPHLGEVRRVYKYFLNASQLDSVVIETEQASGEVPLIPVNNYDFWGDLNSAYLYQSPHITATKVTYRTLVSTQANHIKETFRSLGFIPRALSFYPFDTSPLPNLVTSVRESSFKNNPIVDSIFFQFQTDYSVELDTEQRLKTVQVKSKTLSTYKMNFVYEQ